MTSILKDLIEIINPGEFFYKISILNEKFHFIQHEINRIFI